MFTKTPVYQFQTKNDTGIDEVPDNSLVDIIDFDGERKSFFKSSSLNLLPDTTLEEALNGNNLFSPDQNSTTITVDNITDLATINTSFYDTAVVKSETRGGIFIFDITKIMENNGGTIINGWVRQYVGAIKSTWFDNLQQAFDLGTDIDIIGEYVVNNSLYFSADNCQIKGIQAKIKGNTVDQVIFAVSGSGNSLSDIEIDGNNIARVGLSVTGDECNVQNCYVHHLFGTDYGPNGIEFREVDSFSCIGNRIEYIDTVSDTVLGDNKGAARAILATSVTGTTKPSIIMHNQIKYIQGQEGDAIQVLYYDGVDNSLFLPAFIDISHNNIYNYNRRGIKVQGSNCTIEGNWLKSIYNSTEAPNAATSIDVIHSDNVAVKNNSIDSPIFSGIASNGDSSSLNTAIEIMNNYIKVNDDKWPIAVSYCENGSIIGNQIIGGTHGIILNFNAKNISILNNSISGGDGSGDAIYTSDSGDQLAILNNTCLTGSRRYFILASAPNSVYSNNICLIDTNNTLIRTTSSAVGSIISNNIGNTSQFTIYGDGTGGVSEDIKVFNNDNLNTGGTVANASIIFSENGPTVDFPNTPFLQGSLAFKGSPDAANPDKLGWVCTAGGTPGTWATI